MPRSPEMGPREPEPNKIEGLPFDPEKEIPESAWQGMKDEVEQSKVFLHPHDRSAADFGQEDEDYEEIDPINSDWARDCLETAKNMKIIFPEREGEIPFDDKDRKAIDEDSRDVMVGTFPEVAADLKILLPEKMAGNPILHDEEWWKQVKRWIKSLGTLDQIEQLKNVMIVSPEKASELRLSQDSLRPEEIEDQDDVEELLIDEIDEDLFPKGRPRIYNEMVKELVRNKKGKNWFAFARGASRFRIVIPEMARRLNVSKGALQEELDSHLDSESWQGMRDELKKLETDHNWRAYSNQAADMKILAAEKVEVTNKGLEIKMPESK